MRVLIIGCGYVGYAAGELLARQGHDVFGLRRSHANDDNLRAAGIQPLNGDITKPDELARLPAAFDWVINTVSSTRGGAEEYRAVYLQGMRNVVAWLGAAPPEKFVYTSSSSVYGQEDGSLVDETSLTEPASETSWVLLETENVLRDAARECGFPAVILRVAGIYGPERGYLFKQFLSGELKLGDEGRRISNMIHRDDVAGCLAAALARGRAGEIYNAVDDEPVTWLDFVRWLSDKLNRPMPPVVTEAEPAVGKRGMTNKRISNRKLKTELGYRFQFPTFREGYAAEIARIRER